MSGRRLWLIADDYGLSPGVSASIRELIAAGRLSGTGCMTLFPEWPDTAEGLRALPSRAAIGLHLTLTDQSALSGASALAPEGKLPSLGGLTRATLTSRDAARAARRELDLQYQRFVTVMGRAPDFLDGHQHVHFLPVARAWLAGLPSPRPMVRGAPMLRHAPRAVLAKVAVARLLASGYDAHLRRLGISALKPLSGFYKWDDGGAFAKAITDAVRTLPDGAVFMCHPGHPDDLLARRDRLTAPRAVEHDFLLSDAFGTLLADADVELAGMAR